MSSTIKLRKPLPRNFPYRDTAFILPDLTPVKNEDIPEGVYASIAATLSEILPKEDFNRNSGAHASDAERAWSLASRLENIDRLP